MSRSRLGDILLRQQRITREQLDQVVRESKLNGDTLTSQLVKQDIFTEEQLVAFVARSFGCPVVDLDKVEVDPEASKVPFDILRKNVILPLRQEGNMLKLAVADPYDINALDEIAFISGKQIDLVIAAESDLIKKLDALSGTESHLQDVMADLGAMDVHVVEEIEEDVDELSLSAKTEAAPVVRLINLILLDAIKRGASDIHLEPYEKVLRVRYRIDGVLHEIMRPRMNMRDAMISRLKILARLDISERRIPQDGRIKLRLSRAKTVDFRVSVLPTLFGEKVVLRLLDPSSLQLDMTKLGYSPQALGWLKETISRPYGMVLVTGPTGSGKTVSLYSAVAELNQPGVNICTAEDPVEFNFMGINQVNVKPDIGLDFPASLRSFLRQDPDIILIGEIRDYDTAAIGIKAALTGHLVLATLHTNDAPSTMTRLVNMGVESFLVGSAVNLVSAQRLARRICADCKTEMEIPASALLEAGVPEGEVASYRPMHGTGCPTCSGTGYKGRTGIYQVMPVFDEIREAVYTGENSDRINEIAVRMGVKTLRMEALEKVKAGEITLEECLRVTVAG
ncbi:type IV pilus assembly protein PilB [Mariprofundus aestuarium]|uniref:Type IV pilus assembly protein PilB n=1 Tax=Mariprofundus aestuarium TaxID=1921086 RepID=A0A2K8KVS1_MARES|nr:type IV-A pilus assembly ATPase PilB [Mariprofundus aestuarium]ATX78907.1 type IV pilus assembly protein PilB [Mariprofundus aestuarium]